MLLLAACSLFFAARSNAIAPAGAFRYIHDADGRLKAAIDPEGDTAVYHWDPAGNLESISRHDSDQLSVVEISPSHGEIGDPVTIEGTGFDEKPSANVVKFNGKAATVTSATPFSLEVKVPAEASTGAVTAAANEEGPVTGPTFTVGLSGPSISSQPKSIRLARKQNGPTTRPGTSKRPWTETATKRPTNTTRYDV